MMLITILNERIYLLFRLKLNKLLKTEKVKKGSYSKQDLRSFTFLKKRFKRQAVKVIFMAFYRSRINEMIDQIFSETEYHNNKCVDNNNQTEKL